VFYNVDTEIIDFYISSSRPSALTITGAGDVFTGITYTLEKGSQIFWGQYTHHDVESYPVLLPALDLFPALDLYPHDSIPDFIANNINPIISKLFYVDW